MYSRKEDAGDDGWLGMARECGLCKQQQSFEQPRGYDSWSASSARVSRKFGWAYCGWDDTSSSSLSAVRGYSCRSSVCAVGKECRDSEDWRKQSEEIKAGGFPAAAGMLLDTVGSEESVAVMRTPLRLQECCCNRPLKALKFSRSGNQTV